MKRILPLLLGLVLLVLLRTALLSTSGDLGVYLNTAKRLWAVEPLYVPHLDGLQSFKYPPWIAPLFAPLAFLSPSGAEMAWRLSQWASLLGMLLILLRSKDSDSSVYRERLPIAPLALAFISFQGVWNYNLLAGQITPFLCLAALWGAARPTPARLAAAMLALSTKVFPLVAALPPLIDLAQSGKSRRALQALGLAALAAAALSVPALRATPGASPQALLTSFFATASQGGENLAGAQNGLPALLARLFGTPDAIASARSQVGLAAAGLGIAAAAWLWARRRLLGRPLAQAALALALSHAINPLAFDYGLALAFPWFALQLGHFSNTGRPKELLKTAAFWPFFASWAWIILPLPYRALAVFPSLLSLLGTQQKIARKER